MLNNNTKQHIVRTMEMMGIFSLTRRWYKSRIRAPLYHRFSAHKRNGFVSLDTFRKQILYAKKAFTVIHPDKLLHEYPKHEHGMVITIDDGYRDVYDVAYPVLRDASVPAIVYLTTDFVDGKSWMWFDKVVRSPFLDHKFVELAVSLPKTYKIRKGNCKYLLKRAFSDMIPREILDRKKMGFAIPIDRWFRIDLKPLFEDAVLGSSSGWLRDQFDMKFLLHLYEAHQSHRGNHGSKLWLILNFFLWHETFIGN